LEERSTDNRKAEGSNPFRPTFKYIHAISLDVYKYSNLCLWLRNC